MSPVLEQTLRKCERLDEAIATLMDTDQRSTDKRQLVTFALCFAAIEHAIAQRVLIERGLTGTALALIRLQYETTLRAAWTHHGAEPGWIEKFTSEVPPDSFDEPQKGPPIESMLQTLAKHLPAQNMAELRNLNTTLKAMHSFVHGGVYSVVHALRGYPDEKLVDILNNRNLLLWINCQVFALSTNDPGVQQRARQAFQCMGP